MSNASKIMKFLADRLVHVYGENPNVDFVLAAHRYAAAIEQLEAEIASAKANWQFYEFEVDRANKAESALRAKEQECERLRAAMVEARRFVDVKGYTVSADVLLDQIDAALRG